MIQIKIHPEEVDPAWITKADEITKELLECNDDGPGGLTATQKRAKIIDANQRHWGRLKELLSKWSFGKCWYSEVRDLGSDYHVDHYRPKGRVRDEGLPDRDGYWWLAFNWTNLRFAVSWVNSPHKGAGGVAQGKVDHFPIKPGSQPIGSGGSTDDELPLLLDPISETDYLFIDFDETGNPVPTVGGWGEQRVRGTTFILHLDSPRMTEARQKVWRDCERRLQRAHDALNAPADKYNTDREKTAQNWIQEVCEMLRPDAELSAVARACVAKSEHVWARNLSSNPLAQLPQTSS